MKILDWEHMDITPDGILKTEDGREVSLGIIPKIIRSPDDGGCGQRGCACDKMWCMSINFGYDPKHKRVRGITIIFADKKEFDNFIYHGIPASEYVTALAQNN